MNVEEKCKAKLKEINDEIEELYEVEDMYNDQSEFNRFMYKLRVKQYLLEEILGIK